ncbi:hypothetical protein CDD82_803 [Ophiocordyceps australis]|uniref:Uncharacterized protein n=1 Tax=Ophiocordyceps australis TaxID=1399860 RepID=A0A2C5XD91_9HYPO|nr:hypothetical protein CDD82_803 [Ophiocordyceps australis]
MGGYSYGAMVTAQLPPLATLLSAFAAPGAGTAAGEICLQAEHLAQEQRRRQGQRGSYRGRRSLGRRVGGEQGRVSEDGAGRRVGLGALLGWRRKGVVQGGHERPKSAPGVRWEEEEEEEEERRGLELPRAAYVLVSPLQGLVTQLATMSFSLRPRHDEQRHFHHFHHFHNHHHRHGQQQQQQQQQRHSHSAATPSRPTEAQDAEAKFTRHPTLIVYGEKDGLVAAGKVRAWIGRLEAQGAVGLDARGVLGAGHFWVESGVLGELRAGVAAFAEGLKREGEE